VSRSEKDKGRKSESIGDPTKQYEDLDQTMDLNLDATQPLGRSRASQPGQPRPGFSLESGQNVGGYTLIQPLGSGGFAEVWEVTRIADGRKLAFKMLQVAHNVSADAVARFQREGRLAASLSHPRAVGIVSAEIINGSPTILMDVMPGGTLQDLLQAQGPLAWRKAVDAILDVIEGLEAAHMLGIIHRDIKPSNCFVDGEGRVKIGDFGLSKTLEMSIDLTMAGAIIGTPAFASPEQIRGLEVGFQTDQYSAGATLYALLTGKPPYEGVSAGDLLAKITSDTSFTPLKEHGVEIPKGLLRVLKRLLEKDPARRYEDYLTLRTVLVPFSSRGILPGQLGPRVAAGVIDGLLLSVLAGGGIVAVLGPDFEADVRFSFAANVVVLLIFLLLEKFWGKTPGKHFMRLRVASGDGTSLSWPQAIIRNSVWAVPGFIQNLISLLGLRGLGENFFVGIALTAALFVTSRKRNGYAGLHEFLSNTRVIRNRSLDEVVSIQAPAKEVAMPVPHYLPKQLGPYCLQETLWSDEEGSLVVASDDQLGRRVWIYERFYAGSGKPESRGESRATRLAWLQSGQHEDRAWDAFESPSGMPFTDLIHELDWPKFSSVLADLLSEVREGLSKQDIPAVLSLHRLWIDGFGRLKLLEFPTGRTLSPPALGKEFEVQEWPQFIEHVVRTLMPNEESKWSQGLTRSQKDLLGALIGGDVRESDLPTLESKVQELRNSSTALTKKRRFGHLISTYVFQSIMPVIVSGAIVFAKIEGDVGGAALGLHLGLLGFGLIALPAILMSALFGSGPSMWLFGMEVRNARGQRASRARCFGRALLAWAPALVNLMPLTLWLIQNWGNPDVLFWQNGESGSYNFAYHFTEFYRSIFGDSIHWVLTSAFTATWLVFVGGWFWAILSPARGLHDRLAKTHIGLR
jgi:uncharacterized RDD family membrane protein YckC